MNKFEQPPQPKKEETSLEEIKKTIEKGREKLLREEYLKKKEEKEALKKGESKLILREFLEKEERGEEEKRAEKEEQKEKARGILAKFLGKEEAKKKVEEEVEELGKEDIEIIEEAGKELTGEEKKYLEKGELPEKVESALLIDAKRLEASANTLAKQCEKMEMQLKEKGIDVNKMEFSLAERVKFSIKSLFDKKLRNLYKSYENARLAEDFDRSEAQGLRLATADPKEYRKRMVIDAAQKIAERKFARGRRVREEAVRPIGWVKRV